MVYKFFTKKTGLRASVNGQPAENYINQSLKKFKRRKVFARFKENIWAED